MKHVALIYLLLFSCKPEQGKLPILSYTINEQGVKELYTIEYNGDFHNHLNERFNNEYLNNKVIIVNFFFTRCPSICPPMRQQLIGISASIDNDDFLIISHTIDPTNDTPEVLKNYANAIGIPSNRWQFLTASEEQTKAQAKQYKTNFKPNEDGTDFYHSSYVALVDRDRLIRGFYDLLKPKEVTLLTKDIEILLD